MLFVKPNHPPAMSAQHTSPNPKRQNSQGKICSRFAFPNPFRSSGASTTSCGAPRSMRVGLEDEILKKNRRVVENYVRRVGALVGKEICLNSDGMWYFSHGKFIVVIEVPADSNEKYFIYTMVCRVGPLDNVTLILQLAMELNYMGFCTRGSTLGLHGEEVNLCHSGPIAALSVCFLKSTLEDFVQTAVEVNGQLDAAKHVR